MAEPLIFEKSRPGRIGAMLPHLDVPEQPIERLIPREALRRTPPDLPEMAEIDVVRHFTRLSKLNVGIDDVFYPLGSCTMKYNPRLNEGGIRDAGLTGLHPYQPEETVQGMLEMLWNVERWLSALSGLPHISLHPCAGAQGELAALLCIRAWFEDQGERRTRVLIPDSAHGTNPASCTLAGFTPVQIRSGPRGTVDLEMLGKSLGPDVACLMVTNPNTLGLFEEDIAKIASMAHEAGAFLYMDGANFNALVGVARPGDFGVDAMHFNLHKTFTQPHGGGGPGAGPIGVVDRLEPYLPVPRTVQENGRFRLDYRRPKSIGQLRAYATSGGVMGRTWFYMRSVGREGMRRIAENAVLNANYLRALLKGVYHLPYDRTCMHEVLFTAKLQKQKGDVSAVDIGKRLLDYGYHPPTVAFPLVVHDALLIEPTETESKETLEGFAEAMKAIAREAEEDPAKIKGAPFTKPVRRLDDVRAARQPVLRWKRGGGATPGR
jgi:glycine dehydrogenase subunit 2